MKGKKSSSSALKSQALSATRPRKKKPPVIAGTTKMNSHPTTVPKP